MKMKTLKTFAVLACLIIASCSETNKISICRIGFNDADGGEYRLMTFNIRYGTADDGPNRWEVRNELVFDTIADHKADIIGLQEALDFQVTQIRRVLPQYKIVWAGRDDGRQGGEGCPVMFRKDRFKLADSGTFWFSNSPWDPGSKHWGNELPRICTWVRLIDKATGSGVYVYNLHLDHVSKVSRVYSIELLVKQIAAREHDDPVVVLGDFNMGTNNPAMDPLRRIERDSDFEPMVDVWSHLHPGGSSVITYHAFGKSRGGCVDHIFVEKTTEIIETAIDGRSNNGRFPSDHFPVIAVVKAGL